MDEVVYIYTAIGQLSKWMAGVESQVSHFWRRLQTSRRRRLEWSM